MSVCMPRVLFCAMKASSLTTRESRLAWVLATVGGLVLFVYFVERVGIEEIAASVRRVGWAFLLVLLLSGLRFLARSTAWLLCVPSGHNLTLRHIFPAVLAGDAVGNLTPLSVLVGEPVKALYLRHRIGLSRIVPALAVENLFYTLSTVIIIAVGASAVLILINPPRSAWPGIGVPAVTLILLVTAVHFIIWTHTPLLSASLRWLARRGLAEEFLLHVSEKVRNIEEQIQRDYPRDWKNIFLVASLEFLFHALAILEVRLILGLIADRPPTLVELFAFEAANRLITIVFRFVPLRIGVDEAGTAMVANLLAFGSTTGVTMAIVRKGRMLFWVAIGIIAFTRRGLSWSK